MIPITLTTALAVYSAILAGLALMIWVYTETRAHRRRRELGKQFLWRCVYCRYTYLDEHASALSKCPRCASYNAATDEAAREVAPSPAALQTIQDAASHSGDGRNTSKRKRPNQRRRGPRRRR